MKNNLTFYTDGACSGNPGSGGFGVVGMNTFDENKHVLFYNHSEKSVSTTNNREELKAILHVLNIAEKYPELSFTIYSDSAYAVNLINSWIYSWANNNWLNSKKKPVENLDLVKEIFSYLQKLKNVSINKISGHCGILGNELADGYATDNQTKINKLFKNNDIAIRKPLKSSFLNL